MSSRTYVITSDDYNVSLSYEHEAVFLHCDVFNFNKDVYKRVEKSWVDVREALWYEGFEYVIAVPQKRGLVNKLGFEHLEDVEYAGKEYGVYIWHLQSPL